MAETNRFPNTFLGRYFPYNNKKSPFFVMFSVSFSLSFLFVFFFFVFLFLFFKSCWTGVAMVVMVMLVVSPTN